MTTIVIAGAKPGLRIPSADAIYAANAAFLTDPPAFQRTPDLTVVASSLVLSKGLLDSGENLDVYRIKFDAVRNVQAGRIVLLADPTGRQGTENVPDLLRAAMPERPVQVIGSPDRRRLVREITNGPYPVIGRWALGQPASVVFSDARKVLRCVWDWNFGSGHRDVPGRYRPSTGIMALILAISEHGMDARFVLAGIGVDQRDVYRFADGTSVRMNRRNRGLPAHQLADIQILKRLADRVDLTTTEPELERILPRHEHPPQGHS